MTDTPTAELYELAHQMFEYNDGDLVRKVQSRRGKVGMSAIYKSGRYAKTRIKGKQYQAHRIVFLMNKGYLPEIIDHIDGNAFNNRIENLREATQQQNSLNRRLRSDNKCKVPNVYWHKHHAKYGVQVSVDGKQKHFGYYDDVETAAVIAEQARQQHYGSFVYKGERT